MIMMPIFNVVIGIFLLHLAFHPMWRKKRPMTWTRFYINSGLGLLNLVIGVVGLLL